MKKFLTLMVIWVTLIIIYMGFETYRNYMPPFFEKECFTFDFVIDPLNPSEQRALALVLKNHQDYSELLVITPIFFDKINASFSEIRDLNPKEVSCETGK